MRIKISILTPNHLRQSGPWGELIILSHSFPVIPDHVDEQVVERLMENHGHEWSAILIEPVQNGLRACLWRSLTSSFDIYYVLDDSSLFISDTLGGCAVNLPATARTPSKEAIIDHFLFITVFGENTYLERVNRVGHGMRATVDIGNGTVHKEQFVNHSPHPQFDSEERYLNEIDTALEAALAEFRNKDSALLFSGGVDSTLLATYLTDNPLVTSTIPSPEHAGELSYAENSAKLLARETEVNVLLEADYLVRLEETIDRLWMPPGDSLVMIVAEAFRSDRETFILGQYADALFGMCRPNQAYFGPLLARPAIMPMLGLLARLPNRKIKDAWSVSRAFGTPPTLPGSFAFRFARRADVSTVETFASQREINQRLNARYEYVSRIVDFETTEVGRCAQLEIGHQIDYFCDDTVRTWRQLASSYGKLLYAPFVNPRVFDAAMSIPASIRYIKGRNVKHLMKKLLHRRLPSYPVNQPKRGGSVPIRRIIANGPLRDWAERYPLPDFIDLTALKKMQRADQPALWRLILFSMWKGRIRNLASTSPPRLSFEVQAPQ